MMKWILPGIAVLIAGAIAWPYLFGNTTIEVKGKTFHVEHRTADKGPSSRHFPIRDRVALAPDQAILCSWDRDRYLYYWSDGCRGDSTWRSSTRPARSSRRDASGRSRIP